MNRRASGKRYEQLTKDYLQRQGCRILETNFRSRRGEIDLILFDGGYLVFVEVKYRKNDRLGTPEEAVDSRKRARIRQAAAWYCCLHGIPEDAPRRFDVVGILGQELHWIKNAF